MALRFFDHPFYGPFVVLKGLVRGGVVPTVDYGDWVLYSKIDSLLRTPTPLTEVIEELREDQVPRAFEQDLMLIANKTNIECIRDVYKFYREHKELIMMTDLWGTVIGLKVLHKPLFMHPHLREFIKQGLSSYSSLVIYEALRMIVPVIVGDDGEETFIEKPVLNFIRQYQREVQQLDKATVARLTDSLISKTFPFLEAEWLTKTVNKMKEDNLKTLTQKLFISQPNGNHIVKREPTKREKELLKSIEELRK